MHLTLYNFIFQIDKKLVNFRIFWNTLCLTLTTNTGLAINTLTTNTGLAVNTLTTNKACLKNFQFLFNSKSLVSKRTSRHSRTE